MDRKGLRGLRPFVIPREQAMDPGGLLAPLIDTHGPTAVWHTGIRVLGYPPSWFPTVSDVLHIEDELLKRN